MPPLRDAVRLVDGDERQVQARERLHEGIGSQALGRGVDELVLAPQELGLARSPGLRVDRRREERRGDPARFERPDLVLHERDERGENERGPFEQGRGNLVGQRLAAAGGRDDEHAPAAAQDPLDGLALPRPEALQPEALAKNGIEGVYVRHRRTTLHLHRPVSADVAQS